MSPTIAVLALQGAFIEHGAAPAIPRLHHHRAAPGPPTSPVPSTAWCPGGESTVQAKLLHDLGIRTAAPTHRRGPCPRHLRRPHPVADHFRTLPVTCAATLRSPTRQLPRRGSLGRRGEGDRRSRGATCVADAKDHFEQQRHTRFRAGSSPSFAPRASKLPARRRALTLNDAPVAVRRPQPEIAAAFPPPNFDDDKPPLRSSRL